MAIDDWRRRLTARREARRIWQMVDVHYGVVSELVAEGELTMPEAMAALYICLDELAKQWPHAEVLSLTLKAKALREREGW